MKVRNFMFCQGAGAMLDGYAKFTAEFFQWTDEPEIALCKCSHGKFVKIPTFALEGFNPADYPKQEI